MLWSLALALSAAACGQQPRDANGDPSMTTIDRQLAQLTSLISNERIVEAEALARTIGPEAVRALVPLAQHESTDVRLAVLEIASGVQHPDTCQLALRMLFDADELVSSLAATQVSKCGTPEARAPLLEALEKKPPPAAAQAVALQIGKIGDGDDREPLRRHRAEATDLEYRHALSVALVRLGDSATRRELEEQLASPILETRLQALRDIEYVGDPQFVARFADVLDDRRDAIPLSLPDDPPVVFARVCDVAVLTMLRLGVALSYTFDELTRLEERNLDEAKQAVAQRAR
jgi:HEAT repeat protein